MSSLDELTAFLSQTYGLPVDGITAETEVITAFGIDSLGLVTLGDKIQSRFGIELSAVDLIECRTVGDFAALLTQLMDDRAADRHV